MRPSPRAGLAAAMLWLWLGFAAAVAAAEPQAPGAASPASPRPAHAGEAIQIPPTGRPIVLEVGKGTLIRLPRPASTVFVASPDIADVQVKSPELVYITAKAPGETVIYAVDANDAVMLNAPVRVELDLSQLRESLSQLVPGNAISVTQVDANLVLSGAVADAGQAEKARALAAAIAGAVKGGQVINRLAVETPNQVDLRVRIAEVNVSVLNEIGVNWQKLGTNLSFLTNNPVTVAGELTNSLRVGAITGQAASATISALEQEGLITDLAEPNLVAMSGQTASFLAGGEFPVPVAGTASATGFPTITVEFKSFGVSLAFTPTVLDANRLNLRVRPEVSELTTTGEVSVPLTATATVTIPALTVRRADTTVELGSGQSFALAGLLQHTSTQLISKVPWVGDIPILGALFRSNRFQRGETDLVVIVTPYLVNPVATRLAAPTDGLLLPHDAQQVLWGDKWRQQLPGPARGPLDAGGTGLIGPAGFRLD
jgi:pilus assembly protein CpaC